LLFAYVVLGPAHYATEISWNPDRKYFVPHHGVALALAAVAILIAFIDSASWSGFIIWSTLVFCALIVTAKSGVQVMLLLAGAAALTFIMYLNAPWLGVMGILLPTLIHVSLFTLVFMALGALRSRSAFQGALIAVYIAAILLIVLAPPSAATAIPIFATAAKTYFGNVAPALSHVFRVRGLTLDGRLTGLLAFVYTYHYLNWFIKAEVIRWTNIPRSRLALVAGASAASTALYFYDYTIGFAGAAGVQPASRRARIPTRYGGHPSTRRSVMANRAAEAPSPRRHCAAAVMIRWKRLSRREMRSSLYNANNFSALPWAMRSRSAALTGNCMRKARPSAIA
jgi:hypothetical protein